MVLAADDHVYPHRVVVDDDGVIVGRHAVALHNDDIFYGAVLIDGGVFTLDVDVAVDFVVEVDMFARQNFEEDRAVLFVGLALVEELLRVFFIKVHTLRLAVRPVISALVGALVPIQPHPAHAVEDALFVFFCRTLQVGILDAKHEGAASPAREQPVEERGVRSADVERSRRAWCKSYSYLIGHLLFPPLNFYIFYVAITETIPLK